MITALNNVEHILLTTKHIYLVDKKDMDPKQNNIVKRLSSYNNQELNLFFTLDPAELVDYRPSNLTLTSPMLSVKTKHGEYRRAGIGDLLCLPTSADGVINTQGGERATLNFGPSLSPSSVVFASPLAASLSLIALPPSFVGLLSSVASLSPLLSAQIPRHLPAQASAGLPLPQVPEHYLHPNDLEQLARKLENAHGLPTGTLKAEYFDDATMMKKTAQTISNALAESLEEEQRATPIPIDMEHLGNILEHLEKGDPLVLTTLVRDICNILKITVTADMLPIGILSSAMEIITSWQYGDKVPSESNIRGLRRILSKILMCYEPVKSKWDPLTKRNTDKNETHHYAKHLLIIRNSNIINFKNKKSSQLRPKGTFFDHTQFEYARNSAESLSVMTQNKKFNHRVTFEDTLDSDEDGSSTDISRRKTHVPQNREDEYKKSRMDELFDLAQVLENSLGLPLGSIRVRENSTFSSLEAAAGLLSKAENEK